MSEQSQHWSKVARGYEQEFIDPYRADVRNPLKTALRRLRGVERVIADLGCGIGPLLPFLSKTFATVHAVDFAEGMLARARERVVGSSNVSFHKLSFTNLQPLHGQLDVAVAVNSFVLPSIEDLEASLEQVRRCLKDGGTFLGILPAMDGVHYYTMLLVDRALAMGKPMDAARKNAAYLGELKDYDFTYGQFSFDGLEQHFWQPFEIRHRFAKAGFRLKQMKKVHLSWKQFAGSKELKQYAPPWDWFFLAALDRS